MSKSLGNFIRVRELLEEGHDPAAIRHLLISSHYRGELNFTRAGLKASGVAVQRLIDFEARLSQLETTDGAEESALPGLAEKSCRISAAQWTMILTRRCPGRFIRLCDEGQYGVGFESKC